MLRFLFLVFLSGCALLSTTIDARSEGLATSRTRFFYSNFDGTVGSARIMRHYWTPVTHPDAPVDSRLDPRLRKAATIAQERANARSKSRCWQYVKTALVGNHGAGRITIVDLEAAAPVREFDAGVGVETLAFY